MAVPKKKTSPSRRDMRRYSSRWTLRSVNVVLCSHCSAPTRSHRVCSECGHYSGRRVYYPESQQQEE